MLAGRGVTAIWNDVTPDARADFLDWHMREHMAERIALPGFRRARRHVATGPGTRPEFFTLYEADALRTLTGREYVNRLDGPTPWTARVMATLRDTSRALAEVVESGGPGLGGLVLTLRFAARDDARPALVAAVRAAAGQHAIAGAHLCRTDPAASGTGTEERRARRDDAPPPEWFIILEGAEEAALAAALPDAAIVAAGARGPVLRGLYRLEFLVTPDDVAP